MNTLSNIDIIDILHKYGITINGVFSKDLLPDVLKEGWYIINLQNHNKGDGTHWTCFCVNDLGRNQYWDSFGFDCPKHLHQNLKPYDFNNREIQNLQSSACGYFCIALIKFVESGKNKTSLPNLIKRFSNSFSKHTILNDGILFNFL